MKIFTMPVAAMNSLEVNPLMMLSYYESKIAETESILYDLKSKYSFLKKKLKNNAPFEITEVNMRLANIKWRDEIRRCITPDNDNEFYLATSSQISNCLCSYNAVEEITREIKSKISSTLSLMFREGEIGRMGGDNGKDYLYGVAKFFENDRTTLQVTYNNRLEELIHYKVSD